MQALRVVEASLDMVTLSVVEGRFGVQMRTKFGTIDVAMRLFRLNDQMKRNLRDLVLSLSTVEDSQAKPY